GYYHVRADSREELARLRETAASQGVTCFKSGIPGYYEWIETSASIRRAVSAMQMLREGLGPDIDIGVDFHAKTSPTVASIIIKEVEFFFFKQKTAYEMPPRRIDEEGMPVRSATIRV